MPMMRRDDRGMTLIEILVAGIAGVGLLVGAIVITNQGEQFSEKIRGSRNDAFDEVRPAIGVLSMARTLEMADRAVLPAAGVIQARTFVPQGACAAEPYGPACLDAAGNYRWVQFAYLDTDAIVGPDALGRFDDTANGCAQKTILAQHITALTFSYVDHANAPPGGDPNPAAFSPAPRDVNLVQYQVRWSGAISSGTVLDAGQRDFVGTVAMRNVPYADLGAGSAHPTDSGWGMADPAVAAPPAVCS